MNKIPMELDSTLLSVMTIPLKDGEYWQEMDEALCAAELEKDYAETPEDAAAAQRRISALYQRVKQWEHEPCIFYILENDNCIPMGNVFSTVNEDGEVQGIVSAKCHPKAWAALSDEEKAQFELVED